MEDAIVADYVIVGAGSAGCVLANRLSADGKTRVLLLEVGGDDRPLHNPGQFLSNLWIHVPVGYAQTLKDPAVNWLYETEPDPGTGDRRHVWPRGKVLGGSSSINGLLYVLGQRADYDGWAALGCEGWSWEEVRPYFDRSRVAAGSGQDGGLVVSPPSSTHAVSEAVIKACQALGLPRRDYDGPEQEGAEWYALTVQSGRRCSAAVAYLHPAMGRANLRLETHALATRIVLDGRHATGVVFEQRGRERAALARREVILAGGAVNSPQLLQLSGIGPAKVLKGAGVDVVADMPGVGSNVQDHYAIAQTFRLKPGAPSVNTLARGLPFLGEVGRYLTRREGLLALSAAHVAVFCRSRPELTRPDIQFHALPATMDVEKLLTRQTYELEKEPGLTLAPCQLRPESRGTISIRSPDPRQPPAIRPNYLEHPEDQAVAVAGLRWGRRIAAQTPLLDVVDHELQPGAAFETDEALLAFARQAGTTLYHPVGSCAMGTDARAVVDPRLRVHGFDRLRVVDASIMPRLTSGNTNAPTIMIAEKASDMIVQEERKA